MLVSAVGAVLALCALIGARPVEAAWADGEYATASVASTSLVAPSKVSCAPQPLLGLYATYNWTNATTGAPRTGYAFEVYQGSTLLGSSAPAASATSATTSGLLATLLGGVTYTVHLQAVNGLWRSPAVTGTFTTTLAGLITGCTW
jgi:hypothetical protein